MKAQRKLIDGANVNLPVFERAESPDTEVYPIALAGETDEHPRHAPVAFAPVPQPGGQEEMLVGEWQQELDTRLKALYSDLCGTLEVKLRGAEQNIVERILGQLLVGDEQRELEAEDLERQLKSDDPKVNNKLQDRQRHFCLVSRGTTGADFELEDVHLEHNAEMVAASVDSSFVESNAGPHHAESPRISDLIRNPKFETFFALVIFSNAIFIGVQTDLTTKDMDLQTSNAMLVISLVYTLLFTLELSLRIACHGARKFFTNKRQWHWHYLDFAVVVVSLLDSGLDLAVRADPELAAPLSRGASQFRIMRILRTTRIIRGIRMTWIVRFVRSLRTLVHQIVSTARSLIWALLLLVMIIYLFAILFTQGVLDHQLSEDDDTSVVQELSEPLRVYWSTVPRSMFTLFISITGGVSWGEVVLPLSDVGQVWVGLFIAYICFTQMAVLNVLTGVFCQNAIDSAQHDQDLVTQSILAQKKMYVKQIAAIFAEIDTDGSGTITIHEFRKHLQDESVQAIFDSLGLDASDVWTLFKLLDIDHDTVIELDEFVAGCLRLKGNAKGLDMAKLCYEHKSMAKRLGNFMKRTDTVLSRLTHGVCLMKGSRSDEAAALALAKERARAI